MTTYQTYSRYDFMKDSGTVDEKSLQVYPDPLSLDYNNLEITSSPKRDKVTDEKLATFWHESEKAYGKAWYDDVVLTLNGYSHKNLVKMGDIIYFPSQSDIERSFESEE